MRIAAASGLQVVVSSALDTAVGMSAGLALAGALPDLPMACGLGTASLLADDVCTDGFVPSQGTLPVPARSPEPDRRFELRAGRDLTEFWRARLDRVAALLR